MSYLHDYKVTSHILQSHKEIESDWVALQEVTQCSFFQSWGWIGPWLEELALDLTPLVVKVWHQQELISLGIFVEKEIKRRKIFSSSAVFLNEYPFSGRNMVIEYNGLLVRQGHEENAYALTINYLVEEKNKIEEIHFGAIQDKNLLEFAVKSLDKKLAAIQEDESLSWHLDLGKFGQNVDSILDTLSKNRKAQIRRSLRLYEKHGPINISEATTVSEALDYLKGLKQLHTDRWQAKGRKGVFANPKWERFHKSVITQRFEYGEIQLLKVENSEGPIGYLYNYLWRKRVYVLQTGFNITSDKRLLPGYIVHCLAILYNKKKGMMIYDLLHGDSLYKKILCDQDSPLYWVIVQKRKIKFTVENQVVKYVRFVRGLLGSTTGL